MGRVTATVTRTGVAHCNSEKCETPLRVEMFPRGGMFQHGRIWDRDLKKMVQAPPVAEMEPSVFEWDGTGDTLFVSKDGDEWRCCWCGQKLSDTERIRDVITHQEERRGLHV